MSPLALVTGITGQDGSYLAERLLAAGHSVHGVARPGSREETDPRVVVHRADLADTAALRGLVRDLRPDLVVNLGGVTSVAQSWMAPDLTHAVCGRAAVVLLDAVEDLRRTGHDTRFLQAGSAEMFGDAPMSPQDEHTPLAPRSPYGRAKAFAHVATVRARESGVHASTVILYNHESPRRRDQFVSRKITAGAVAIARGETDHLVLGNLGAARDWGWAPDHVDAMVRVLRHPDADDFVVSTGLSHTVEEFAHAALRYVGVSDPAAVIRVDPTLVRRHDVAVQVGDATRLRTRLGWRPTKTFDEVVAALIEAELVRRGS